MAENGHCTATAVTRSPPVGIRRVLTYVRPGQERLLRPRTQLVVMLVLLVGLACTVTGAVLVFADYPQTTTTPFQVAGLALTIGPMLWVLNRRRQQVRRQRQSH